MNELLRTVRLTVLLLSTGSYVHSQFASPPITNTELDTRPGTISGTLPSQNPATVTNVVSVTKTNQTGQVGSAPGTISGGTPAQPSPTLVTNVVVGVDPRRPTPTIEPKIPKGDVTIELQLVAQGLIAPLGVNAPDDGSGRLFVPDQAGLVWVVDSATGATNVLLDVRSRLVPLMPGYDERGLLGFVVHTNFAQNPLVYTYTTEPVQGTADFTLPRPADKQFDHQNVIAEWRIAAGNSNQVDIASRREILRIDQPQMNHNAGTMRFGPDGLLYFGLGDGGGADDQDGQPFLGDVTWGHGPIGNGQNIETLHGSLVRIDVHGTNSVNGRYGIPQDNPFVGTAGLDEIYAYGFRNPYSFSFDRLTGQIYLGDAGENSIEEVDRVIKGGNYGWNLKEGSFLFDPNGLAPGTITNRTSRALPPDLINPIAEFDHDEGRVIVGGFVYRGTNIPALAGKYLASDFLMQNEPYTRLLYVDLADTNRSSLSAFKELRIGLEDRRTDILVRGFGEDAHGELYLAGSNEVGPMGRSGKIFRIVSPPPMIVVTNNTRLVATNGTTTVTNIAVAWSGGLGPFGVEQKLTLSDLLWNLPLLTTNRQATVLGDGPSSVLRLVEKPHVIKTAFSAVLGGTNVIPTSTQTPANGLGFFLLEGNELTYMVLYSNLLSSATAAFIHGPADPTNTGPAIVGLQPFGGPLAQTGILAGSTTLGDLERLALLNGETYVSLRSSNYPEGEVRGQIVPSALASPLRGAWERPVPVNTPALGNALLSLLGNQLTLILNYQGLSSPAIVAHLHGPAGPDEVAPPMVDLTPLLLASGTNGTLAGTVTLTDQQINYIAAGKTYLNVHSQIFTNGEIRGQIFLVPGVTPLTVSFSGQAQRPTPVNTPAGGFGLLAMANNRVMFEMMYTNLSGAPTASHIHLPASVTEAAPPVVPLTPFTVATSTNHGFISGMLDLPVSATVDILNVRSYVNIHTAANPDGEIRSQIAPALTRASLSGIAERPVPIATPGMGAGLFVLVGNQLNVRAAFGNLSAPAIAAHIHGPANLETAAGILVPFTQVPPAKAGAIVETVPLTFEQWNQVISGQTYINVHTTNNPAGEIRGQILP